MSKIDNYRRFEVVDRDNQALLLGWRLACPSWLEEYGKAMKR